MEIRLLKAGVKGSMTSSRAVNEQVDARMRLAQDEPMAPVINTESRCRDESRLEAAHIDVVTTK